MTKAQTIANEINEYIKSSEWQWNRRVVKVYNYREEVAEALQRLGYKTYFGLETNLLVLWN